MDALSEEEREFVEQVRPLLERYLALCKRKGVEPGAGSFVLSEEGRIYHGVPFHAARSIHGEENAIGAMVTHETIKSKLKMILIVGPPHKIVTPCGICREAIYRYSGEEAIVLCADLHLSKIRRFTLSQLYPQPYEGAL